METVVERPAALDVHKAQVTACARVPGVGGRREQYVAEFATTVRGLLELRDWLAGLGVTQVVMEATGVYWKAPWAILEDEFDCRLPVGQRPARQAGPGPVLPRVESSGFDGYGSSSASSERWPR